MYLTSGISGKKGCGEYEDSRFNRAGACHVPRCAQRLVQGSTRPRKSLATYTECAGLTCLEVNRNPGAPQTGLQNVDLRYLAAVILKIRVCIFFFKKACWPSRFEFNESKSALYNFKVWAIRIHSRILVSGRICRARILLKIKIDDFKKCGRAGGLFEDN